MPYITLKGEMAKRDITIKTISELLGIHRNSVSNKLEGNTNFSIDEAVKIRNAFFPDMRIDFLFDKEISSKEVV